MKHQVYFSKEDPLGVLSKVQENYSNHIVKKGHYWGSDEQCKNLFPRGKTWGKLWSIQFDSEKYYE